MTFADKIKRLRVRLKLTQHDLARLLDVSQSSIACWETGVNECAPGIREKLKALTDKAGIRISWRK